MGEMVFQQLGHFVYALVAHCALAFLRYLYARYQSGPLVLLSIPQAEISNQSRRAKDSSRKSGGRKKRTRDRHETATGGAHEHFCSCCGAPKSNETKRAGADSGATRRDKRATLDTAGGLPRSGRKK
jgi:hypothetical protein